MLCTLEDPKAPNKQEVARRTSAFMEIHTMEETCAGVLDEGSESCYGHVAPNHYEVIATYQ